MHAEARRGEQAQFYIKVERRSINSYPVRVKMQALFRSRRKEVKLLTNEKKKGKRFK